jgi:hypothetical protein
VEELKAPVYHPMAVKEAISDNITFGEVCTASSGEG